MQKREIKMTTANAVEEQISISRMHEREIKMTTANAVEELINKLSVKISTDSDVKLLVDTIYKRDVLIAQQDQAMEKVNLVNKKLEAKVTLLAKSEDKMASLLVEQRKLITSSLSLNSRDKRLKLASRHSVTFLSTKPDHWGMKVRDCLAQVPPAELLPEIAMDNLNRLEVVQSDISVNQEMRNKQKEELSRMVGVVENLSNKYSPKFARYGKYFQTNYSTQRKGRPTIVPKVFNSIWKLLLKPPPPVKKIQDLTPQVNFCGINFNMKKNLPKPSYYPLKGVSNNTEMYNTTSYRDHMGKLVVKPATFAEGDQPFGGFHGGEEAGTAHPHGGAGNLSFLMSNLAFLFYDIYLYSYPYLNLYKFRNKNVSVRFSHHIFYDQSTWLHIKFL